MTDPTEHDLLDLPVLPLRDVVVFPHMVIPLFVGRDKSIRALDVAMEADKRILLVAQKSAETDDPGAEDLYGIGTLAHVLQLLKLPDGTIKVLVEGVARVQLTPRELTTLRLMADGRSNKEIANDLGISERTVKTHLGHLFDKLGVTSRTEAAKVAARRGLIRLD